MRDVEISQDSPLIPEVRGYPPQPRLGIAHFMAWTAGSAAILAVQRALGGWEAGWEGQPESFRVVYLVMSFPNSMVYGALVGSLMIAVARRMRGAPFPVHPGQWLAALGGVVVIGNWLGVAAYRALPSAFSDEWRLAILFGNQAAFNSVLGAGCVIAAFTGNFERRWKAALIAIAVEAGLSAMAGFAAALVAWLGSTLGALFWYQGQNAISMFVGLATLALIALAVRGDWRCRTGRDWMHYVGLIGVAWNVAATWIYAVWNWATAWMMN